MEEAERCEVLRFPIVTSINDTISTAGYSFYESASPIHDFAAAFVIEALHSSYLLN